MGHNTRFLVPFLVAIKKNYIAGDNVSDMGQTWSLTGRTHVQEFTHQTDQHHRTIYTADSLNLWVSFYCDFYGAVMLAGKPCFSAQPLTGTHNAFPSSRKPRLLPALDAHAHQPSMDGDWTVLVRSGR